MNPVQYRQWLRLQGINPDDVGIIAGAETGAFASANGAWRMIGIGVATGALTFVVTRILEDLFPRRRR